MDIFSVRFYHVMATRSVVVVVDVVDVVDVVVVVVVDDDDVVVDVF